MSASGTRNIDRERGKLERNDAMRHTTPASDDHQARAVLPTRVSNACERCRRNKSRCDPFRPCSLCTRAGVRCEMPDVDVRTRNHGRPRKKRPRLDAPRSESSHSRSRSPRTADAESLYPLAAESLNVNPRTFDQIEGVKRDLLASTDNDTLGQTVDYGEAESAMGIARKICQLGSQQINERTTSAIPDGGVDEASLRDSRNPNQKVSISSILGGELPGREAMYTLLEEYFDAVHWFSLVIYEPKFRLRLRSVQDGFALPSQKPFLILLSTVLGMAAWYRSKRNRGQGYHEHEDWQRWSAMLLKLAEQNLVEVMDQNSITAVQTCTLLGSYHVYHGRPNLSFALLGASIKISQAIGLHREPLRGSMGDIEERKRIWWTVYTWDRFAAITYGRPLGIDDKDCSTSMPGDTLENPLFKARTLNEGTPSVCYSAYQRELNTLYMMASPALKRIFGIRTVAAARELAGTAYTSLVKEVTNRLWGWRRHLPRHLDLDLERDYQHPPDLSSKAHILQALALQLTFDNLLIILHRPFLVQQVEYLSKSINTPGQGATHSPATSPCTTLFSPECNSNSDTSQSSIRMSSSEQWCNAAVRTSRVTELPILAQLATESHLIAFMAINLFHSAIVMVIMALSDPLSNRAQKLKRVITRIYRLQDLLGKTSTLSKQSSTVLNDVIHMLLRREAEAMLTPTTELSASTSQPTHATHVPSQSILMSVEDTLRLPLDVASSAGSQVAEDETQINNSRALRFSQGLASLQRVLPSGWDCFHPSQSTGIEEDGPHTQGLRPQHESSDNAWGMPEESQSSYVNAATLTGEDVSVGPTDNGLYWLWDMTWD